MAKTYRVAVIGHTGRGDYGHGLDEVWLEVPNAEIVAVADADKPGLAKAAKKLKVDRAYADYRQMLERERPEIVSIAPRWIDEHHAMALAAAEHGCHIYIEKPFCRTLVEADDIIRTCEMRHTKLAISHQTRYSPRIAAAKELIAGGKLGTVLEYRGRGKEDRRGGAEDLWVLGTHIMDLIRVFGGNPDWCFGSVTQDGRPIARGDIVEGAEGLGPLAGDQVRAMYGMPKGATAYFASSRNVAAKTPRFGLQIFGSAGTLEIITGHMDTMWYLPDGGWSPGRSGAVWQPVTSAGLNQPEPIKDRGLHGGNLLAVSDLLASIEEDRLPLGNMYEARAAMEMILAVFESQRVGKPVDLPLATRAHPLTLL